MNPLPSFFRVIRKSLHAMQDSTSRKFFGVTVKYFRLKRRYRETFSPEVIPGTGISSEERVHTRHTHTHTHTLSSDLITSHGSSVLKHIICASTALPSHFPSIPSIIVLCKFAGEVTRNRLFLDDVEKGIPFFRITPCFFRISLRTVRVSQTSLHLWIFYIFFGYLWILE